MEQLTFTLLMLILVFFSCRNESRQIDSGTYQEYISRGNQVSGLAQGVLLANVGNAMQQGGQVHAVEFCNLKASTLIDSLNL